MKNLVSRKNLRSLQIGKLRSAVLMAILMLALPILLAACGKSEWRETKAPAPAPVKTEQAPAPQAEPPAPQPVAPAAPVAAPAAQPVPAAPKSVPPVPKAPAPVAQPAAPKAVPPVVASAPKAPSEAKPIVKPEPRVVKKLEPSKRVTQAIIPNADRYVMVQNIATSKLRVYEIAKKAGEPNLLVFETDMINGEVEPAKTRRTALGSYKIEKWIKFYQDNAGLFPSWYDLPERFESKMGTPPPTPSNIYEWTRAMYMPLVDGKSPALVRGAFGWFTAKIGPEAHAQWTHGTVGWGHDQDQFIQISKADLAQFYSDPRGYGCTRVENRAIAYLQDLLPAGTRVVKVYAKETVADKKLARYKDQKETIFEYALTVDEVRKVNPNSISRWAQVMREIPAESVLEEGDYKIDSIPTAVPFKKSVGNRTKVAMVNSEANIYELPESSFKGEFVVDEGRFNGYKAPIELRTGGFKGEVVPAVLKK